MYEAEDLDEAKKRFGEWTDILPPASKKGYAEWCTLYDVDEKCFDDWRSFSRKEFLYFKPYILNYFLPECRFTNAAAEGANRLIDSINTNGSGYEFKHLRAKCLYCSLVHEQINYGINLKTVTKWPERKHDYMDMMFMIAPSSKTYYSFTNERSNHNIPALNIYQDNSWLEMVFDESFVGSLELCSLNEDSIEGYKW